MITVHLKDIEPAELYRKIAFLMRYNTDGFKVDSTGHFAYINDDLTDKDVLVWICFHSVLSKEQNAAIFCINVIYPESSQRIFNQRDYSVVHSKFAKFILSTCENITGISISSKPVDDIDVIDDSVRLCDNPLADKEGCRWRHNNICVLNSGCYFEPIITKSTVSDTRLPKLHKGDRVSYRSKEKIVDSEMLPNRCYKVTLPNGQSPLWIHEDLLTKL